MYRFGPFRLDTEAYRLSRETAVVAASPKLLDLLGYLAARPSKLVTRDELFSALWPDVIVSDNALTQLVSELRQALGDPSAKPRYVQTVARRGYRFIADVEGVETASPRQRTRETSNLDALRAVSEGRLQLEALDSAKVEAAIKNFEQAIALDPNYAAGYIGLANAHFWQYETSRFSFRPDSALLATAVNEARRAIALAPDMAEAHATLAYLLTSSGRADEGRAAAGRAIALEPQYWAHYFRLGNASWGEDRLNALRRALDLYPAFPFAHFQMAMVHVARQAQEKARHVLEEGIALQDEAPGRGTRFPASGLHWILGAILLARNDVTGALARFDRELGAGGHGLYAREFAVAALNWRGFALTKIGEERLDAAQTVFQQSLEQHPEQARPRLGLALIKLKRGDSAKAHDDLAQARTAIDALRQGGRLGEAALMFAAEQAVQGRVTEAVGTLDQLLTVAPPGFVGWNIPIDPLFAPFADLPAFKIVLQKLAARAA